MGFFDRFKNSWNAFFNKDPTDYNDGYNHSTHNYRPDRYILNPYNGRSIMAPAINRIATDVSNASIEHVRLNMEGRYLETINDSLNDIFTFSANIDQSGQAFVQDIVMSMCDEGVVAIVPTDAIGNPFYTDSYKIITARVAKIVSWHPDSVTVRLYNEYTGNYEEKRFPKRIICIIENPFYQLMNAPNSTLQRLVKKLALLDSMETKNGAGKLDLIIQLPYVVKSEQKRAQAELRKREIEQQLIDSPYGIAYTDGTERITQLNRPAENTLVEQINDLKLDIYNQLGMTQSVFDGTADESTMINYENRTIKVILNAIVNEVRRKWISKTARSQGQSIIYIMNPFRHLTVSQISEAADKFTRNEILSSNEIRSVIGYKPSDNPDADALRNKNLNKNKDEIVEKNPSAEEDKINLEKEKNQNGI